MKKFLALALIPALLLSLTACSVTVGGSGPRSAEIAGHMASSVYYMHYTMDVPVNGQTRKVEFEVAVQGGDAAERSGLAPDKIGMEKSLTSYLVDYDAQTVTNAAQNLTPEFTNTFDFRGLTYIKSGTIPDSADSGKTYAYEEYSTDAGKTVRFCYDGGKLAGLQLLDGDTVATAISILELSDQIPDYMFDIPADFTAVEGS